MKCETFADDFGELVDGTLAPVRQGALERHLEVCDACRALAADLRAIRGAAFTLDRLEPGPQVWQALRARIELDPPATRAQSMLAWTGGVAWRPWLAAAAALLLATAFIVWSVAQPNRAPLVADDRNGVVPADELVASVEADLQAAESHYEKAIQGLELIAKSDTDALDPGIAIVLQKNLQVIDQAIDESRTAVRSQPTSANAQDSLFDAMRNKVALLQQTVELINEMRKGNQAEAGRIMQGLKQP